MKQVLKILAWLGIGISTLSLCVHLILFFKYELFNYENWGALGELLVSPYFLWWYALYAVTIVLWYLSKEKKAN